MFWCHACQLQTTTSVYSNTCSKCGSAAIEKMEENCGSAPNDFRPYVIGQRAENTQVNQQIQNEDQQDIEIPLVLNIRTVFLQSLDRPGQFTVIRVVSSNLHGPTDTRTPVSEQVIGKLQKVPHVQQCAICHQQGKQGLKLKCSHAFHQSCLKPWFQQTNTCPTCRTQIK